MKILFSIVPAVSLIDHNMLTHLTNFTPIFRISERQFPKASTEEKPVPTQPAEEGLPHF